MKEYGYCRFCTINKPVIRFRNKPDFPVISCILTSQKAPVQMFVILWLILPHEIIIIISLQNTQDML